MRRARRLGLAMVALAALVGALVQAHGWARDYYQSRALATGQSTLLLVSEAVDQAVGRFAPIPGLIASEPTYAAMLKQQSNQGFGPYVNEKLRQLALSFGASEVFVMDMTGRTVATSNYRDPDSFLDQSFAYRPYFTQAAAGRAAFFHALGTTSGERGFFFSAPILDGIEVVGVLAVKQTVGRIESDWSGTGREILIADENGIVFMSSRTDYRFRALAPLTRGLRDQIEETRQFPLDRVQPIDLSANVIAPGAVQVMLGAGDAAERYLADSLPLELAGWHAIVLTPMGPVQRQVWRSLALGTLALMAMGLAALLVAQRRAHIRQRIRFERRQRALLEDKVQQRTADLDAANDSLRAEINERRRTEDRLRKSQKELIQAGKLAALGQMSAAISHEINQPLAAMKSYADNATQYMARARYDEAGENIRSISQMSDRMADILRHLRNFARQPGDTLRPVEVNEVIGETLTLTGPQLRARDAEIRWDPGPARLVLGGKLRLQQVLVNIITNALEAMKDDAKPVLEIEVTETADTVQIHLRDHGPGLPPETRDQVFDAFFTTKEAGSGMGLGMSISHNIISDFGGALVAENHPEGGAVFTVALQRHTEEAAA